MVVRVAHFPQHFAGHIYLQQYSSLRPVRGDECVDKSVNAPVVDQCPAMHETAVQRGVRHAPGVHYLTVEIEEVDDRLRSSWCEKRESGAGKLAIPNAQSIF